MSGRIREVCYACTEPILADEELIWAVPPGHGEYEEPFHGECTPSTFFVEEEDIYPVPEAK